MPLVGELGQSTIQKVLSHTENPGNAIREIQMKASLRNPHCRPLLSLLDELGVTRCTHALTQLTCSAMLLLRDAAKLHLHKMHIQCAYVCLQ